MDQTSNNQNESDEIKMSRGSVDANEGSLGSGKKKSRFGIGVLVGIVIGAVIITGVWGAAKVVSAVFFKGNFATESTSRSDMEHKLDRLNALIEKYYLYEDEIDKDALVEGIYSGYAGALGDPYTEYYDEQEAKELLQLKGYIFDNQYYDDNSSKSMPDLKFQGGNYLEVTHTQHNNKIAKSPTQFDRLSIREKTEKLQEISEAQMRFIALDYERNIDGSFTEEGKCQFDKDKRLLAKSFNYKDGQPSEFKSDIPVIEADIDNIIAGIKKKEKLHPKGDTDLFIFVLDDEFDCMEHLLKTKERNGVTDYFLRVIEKSPFEKVFICEWDFEKQCYIKENPRLICYTTIKEQEVSYIDICSYKLYENLIRPYRYKYKCNIETEKWHMYILPPTTALLTTSPICDSASVVGRALFWFLFITC